MYANPPCLQVIPGYQGEAITETNLQGDRR
jgi:hypothetical protein